MHPNQIFRETDSERNHTMLASAGFGALVVNGDDVPHVAHIPYHYDRVSGQVAFHLVRSNPIARVLVKSDGRATLIINGPHGYISPDWYVVEDQVPTWNYVAIHATGSVAVLPDDQLEPILNRLSDHFEADLLPKPIWKMSKLTEDVKIRMMRQIVPCVMQVDMIDGTWKLGQNKADAVRLAAAKHLRDSGDGSDRQRLADLMEQAT